MHKVTRLYTDTVIALFACSVDAIATVFTEQCTIICISSFLTDDTKHFHMQTEKQNYIFTSAFFIIF